MRNYPHSFARLMDLEGFEAVTLADGAGLTKFGLTTRTYGPKVKDMTLADAFRIYFDDYWKPLSLGEIHDAELAAQLLAFAVNTGGGGSGSRPVGLVLQRALNSLGAGLVEDGGIGPKTIAAANGPHPDAILAAFMIEAGLYYRLLNKPNFIPSWLARLTQ